MTPLVTWVPVAVPPCAIARIPVAEARLARMEVVAETPFTLLLRIEVLVAKDTELLETTLVVATCPLMDVVRVFPATD